MENQIYSKIFRAYDIRGIYPNEINEDFAYELGKALSSYFCCRNKKVVINSDVRISSESLKNSLIKGLVESGMNVIDIGINPTPLCNLAVILLNCRFGVTITASHNPKEWNGFIINDKGLELGLDYGLSKVKEIFISKNFKKTSRIGNVQKINIEELYIKYLKDKFCFESNLKVLIDAGNGAASELAPKIVKMFNKGNVIELYCRFDGNFPNRSPEPKKENLSKLIEKILTEKADIGFAYDGDADRVVIVDEKGNVLSSHQILSLLMHSYGKKMKNKKVVIEVLSSLAAIEEIKKFGAKPIVSKVGRCYIQREMFKNKAFLGAEISYHFYVKENFYLDDTIFITLKILEFLSKTNKKVSEIVKDVPSYYYETKRIETKEELKFKIVEELKEEFKDYKPETIDGVKIWIDKDSWITVRPSNTEPKISIAYESKNEKRFEELKQIVERIAEKIKIS
ncbi:MAG: phosphomannomutase/phosphoglucomutase [Candidatus Aenigmatarchaeota archaeon]